MKKRAPCSVWNFENSSFWSEQKASVWSFLSFHFLLPFLCTFMHFQPSEVMNLLTVFSGTNFILTSGIFLTETDNNALITLQFCSKFQWIKDSKELELITLVEVEGGNFFCQTDLFASWQFLAQPKMTRCLSKDWLLF